MIILTASAYSILPSIAEGLGFSYSASRFVIVLFFFCNYYIMPLLFVPLNFSPHFRRE